MDTRWPATALAGTRRGASCETAVIATQMKIPAARTRLALGLLQAVLIDDDMEVLNLSCHGWWNLNRKRFIGLWKQGLLNVSVGNPYNLAIVVVETRDYMRD